MGIYYIPDSLLNGLPVFFHFILMTTHEIGCKLPCFYQGENWDSEEGGNTRQKTQVVSDKARMEAQPSEHSASPPSRCVLLPFKKCVGGSLGGSVG